MKSELLGSRAGLLVGAPQISRSSRPSMLGSFVPANSGEIDEKIERADTRLARALLHHQALEKLGGAAHELEVATGRIAEGAPPAALLEVAPEVVAIDAEA